MTRTILETLPLENGDCLTRGEFERRYQTLPFLKKAELIEGVVYMSSPVRVSHGESPAHLLGWLYTYLMATPGISLADNTTVRLDADNEPQPDALLRIQVGGQSRISGDGYIEGAPELMAEVAGSSASLDLRDKLRVYRRNQVQEYLVWRVYEGEMKLFFRFFSGFLTAFFVSLDGA